MSSLCLSHKNDSLGALELRVVLLGDVVLALPLDEGDQGNLLIEYEEIDCGDERLAHGVHECRRRESCTTVETEERRNTTVRLQSGLIDIEVHSVDAFDLESHVFAEHFGNSTW